MYFCQLLEIKKKHIKMLEYTRFNFTIILASNMTYIQHL